MTTTTASSEVTADRSSRSLGVSARCRNRLIGPATDSSASMSPSAISPPSMTRRRGRNWPYALSSRMPITMPPPSGSTMTAKSFGSSPSAVSAKSGPSTPSTPTSDAVIPRYSSDQPIERLRPDEAEALAQLGDRRLRPPAASSPTGCGPVSVGARGRRRRRRQRQAERRRDEVQGRDDEDHGLRPGDVDRRAGRAARTRARRRR